MLSYNALKGLGFINSDNFVTAQPYAQAIPGEGNGWLQTGLWASATLHSGLSVIGWVEMADIFEDMFKACRRADDCPQIWRSPHKKNPGDNQNHDDYWGALAISYFIGGDWAKEVVQWGEKTGWFFDIEAPERKQLRYYFGRFPDFIPFARLCAGQKLGLTEVIFLAGSIIWDAFHISAADANMRAFCKISVAEQKSFTCFLASLLWFRRVRKRYGTVGNSWAEYFGKGHPCNNYDGE
jgi:hypothetical protein